MRTEWFVVINARGSWWVDNEGTEFGPFATKEQAGTEALTIARSFGERSRRSQVYVPDSSGKHQLVWEGGERQTWQQVAENKISLSGFSPVEP